MIRLNLKILLVLTVLIANAGAALALPKCKGSPASGVFLTLMKNWDSCVGYYETLHSPTEGEWIDKESYGVFKNGRLHGYGFESHWTVGTYSGFTLEGIFRKNRLIKQIKHYPNKKIEDIKIDNTLFSNSKKQNVTALEAVFTLLSLEYRKDIQKTLKNMGYYKLSIDGLYGKGTRSALTKYNKEYLVTRDLKDPKNVTALIGTLTKLTAKHTLFLETLVSEDAIHENSPGKPVQPAKTIILEEPQKTGAIPQTITSDVEPVSIPEPKPAPEIVTIPKIDTVQPPRRDFTKEFDLSFYGSFLHSEKVPNALFFFGDVEKSDSFEFRKALRNHEVDLIVLSSPGGLVWEGLSIAGIIHDKQLDTYVPKNSLKQKGNCASACSFMFFAEANRQVNGKLGVHQFFSGDSSKKAEVGDTQRTAQFTVSEIIGFLNEFETPPWVFERMFQQSEMYYFKESELLQLETETTERQQAIYRRAEAFISELKTAFEDVKD